MLSIHKFAKETRRGDEGIVGAILLDPSVANDEDALAIANGSESVGNDDRCAACADLLEGVLDQLLADGIESAGGLIKKEDGRI